MTTAPAAKSPSLKASPLYKKLAQVLPIFVKNPFDDAPELDVRKLQEATGKSHEAVYKWLRKSKLHPDNATLIVDLANRDDNVSILKKLDRTPPSIADFHEFVFGAA